MGIFFTLLYILTAYLSPPVVFGPLTEYHVVIFIAALATIVSLPAIFEFKLLRMPQTLAIAGMTFAVFASLVSGGWLGGAPAAVYEFLPNVFIYFLIVLHCKTKRHLQLIILTLFFVAGFVTVHGWLAIQANEIKSLYLYQQGVADGKAILRLRGRSFIADPNDFSQLLVSLLPAAFFFWKKDAPLRNVFLVLIPVGLLVYAMYLTHSRGAVIALLVVIILAGRRKLGSILSLVLAGIIFVASSAAGWSGGREISVEAGNDRMEAWAVGLQLIRSHPIFGVGLFRFPDYNEITAHNTVVVCAAELGFVGLLFWVLFVFCSLRYGVLLTKPKVEPEEDFFDPRGQSAQSFSQPRALPFSSPLTLATAPSGLNFAKADAPYVSKDSPYLGGSLDEIEEDPVPMALDEENEVHRLAALMVITLCGYLAAGWFLSRAYVMTLYIYGGMMQVVLQMATAGGFPPKQTSITRLFWMSAALSIGLLLLVYAILRLKKFFPG